MVAKIGSEKCVFAYTEVHTVADTGILLDDLPSVVDGIKRTFYLIIDIDETIRSERDIVDYCIYGGWINKEYVEVYGKKEALPIFEDLIPDILRREMILCG